MEHKNVFDTLTERGFLDAATDEEELRELLGKEPTTFYIGFDATADSLTLGHFLQVRVMQHMQQAGHRPIALLGGGTTVIGDPSGKSDMRKLLTREMIDHNAQCFYHQLSRFLDFSDGKAILDNNANWLLDLNFLQFAREIGVHFSVNRMLTFDCYKNRMERGLTFFEFCYMLMQSYDFLYLYRKYNCKIQLGGSDQWSNIIGGYELIRKKEQDKAYGMTFKLLTTAAGIKMGKTEKGAIWLDAEKTSPYEMFQYLRNCDDRDVIKFMKLLTMLSMEEIAKYETLEGAELNRAKEVLAFEIVKDVHSEEEAQKALEASRSLFGGGKNSEDIPATEMPETDFASGKNIIELFHELGLVASLSEGRRLQKQGGLSLNDEKVTDATYLVTPKDFSDSKITLRKGKKVYHQVKLTN